jgi:hypothetical protein
MICATHRGEILHLALPPNAFCIPVENQTGLEKAGIGSPRYLSRWIRIASQVVAG